jgi:hypothetical protein
MPPRRRRDAQRRTGGAQAQAQPPATPSATAPPPTCAPAAGERTKKGASAAPAHALNAAHAAAHCAKYAACVLMLLAAAGLFVVDVDVFPYENGSGAATMWAPELTATAAASGCAEPFASSPPDLSAATARQVSSSSRSAGGFASWFHAPTLRESSCALLAVCATVAEHDTLAMCGALVLSLVITVVRLRGLEPAAAAPTEPPPRPQPQPQPQPQPVALKNRYGARGSGASRAATAAAVAAEERRAAALEMLASSMRDIEAACARASVRARCLDAAMEAAFALAVCRLNDTVDGYKDKPEAEMNRMASDLASVRGMWRPFYEKLMRDAGAETDDDDDDGGDEGDDGAFHLADVDEDWEDDDEC